MANSPEEELRWEDLPGMIQEGLARFRETGEPAEYRLFHVEELKQAFLLLEVASLRERILWLEWESDYGGENIRRINSPQLEENTDLEMLLSNIGDMGMDGDFPNDFVASAAFRVDQSTTAVAYYKSEECAIVCDDCLNSDNATLHDEFSCEHHEGEYEYLADYALIICTAEKADTARPAGF